MSAQPTFLLSLIWVRHPHLLDPLGQDETLDQRRERIEAYIEEHCPVVFSQTVHKKTVGRLRALTASATARTQHNRLRGLSPRAHYVCVNNKRAARPVAPLFLSVAWPPAPVLPQGRPWSAALWREMVKQHIHEECELRLHLTIHKRS